MTVHKLDPGRSEILARADFTEFVIPPDVTNQPGGLYPLKLSVYKMDEYRIMAGWPVPVPDYDIRADSLISCTGEVIAFRENPRNIRTGAMVRWIADSDTYDTTALRWKPYQASIDAEFLTGTKFSPVYLSDYTYRVGNEQFNHEALNFDSDTRDHFWADLNSTAVGGSLGYTVIMVVNLNSAFGNSTQRIYNGIWSHGLATPADDNEFFEATFPHGWVEVTLQGEYLHLQTEQTELTRVMPIGHLLARSAPFYLAMSFGRPYAYFYAGTSPAELLTGRCYTGFEPNPLTGSVVLGRTHGDVNHTADMGIFDLGVYPGQMVPLQIRNEVSLLSAVYGGDK